MWKPSLNLPSSFLWSQRTCPSRHPLRWKVHESRDREVGKNAALGENGDFWAPVPDSHIVLSNLYRYPICCTLKRLSKPEQYIECTATHIVLSWRCGQYFEPQFPLLWKWTVLVALPSAIPPLMVSASYWTFVSTISSEIQATKWGESVQLAWLPTPVILLSLLICMSIILLVYIPCLPIPLTKHGLQQQLYGLGGRRRPSIQGGSWYNRPWSMCASPYCIVFSSFFTVDYCRVFGE